MNKLATIFSIVITVGFLLAAVSGVVWIISALRHRETVAKALCFAGLVVSVVGFVMFLRNYDSSLHRERPKEPQLPAVQSETQGQPQEPAQGLVPESVEEPEGTAPAEAQEPVETPQKPAEAGESENPLNALPLQTRPVMNGFKTEQIGTQAYIETTKAAMKDVTDQQLKDYLTNLDAEDYNWFNVFFEDGTGLYCMTRMEGYYVEYGPIDKAEGGSVSYEDSRIYNFMDGVYQQIGGLVDVKAINAAIINAIPQKYQDEHWFFADCSESGNSGDEVAVSVQIDQGTDDLQSAKDLAVECYAVVKDAVVSAGCKLDRFDLMVVNKGAPVVGLMTEDGTNYTTISNGRRSEFTIP